ncbi:MAG TPA: TonB family protein [Terriglobales bacterium]
MSAVLSSTLEETPQRSFHRHPIGVPLDLIVLRSGVPETLPGRCTDISEVGVGAVIAGEMAAGQQVAVELRLPNVGIPVRARALVRYQSRLRCGLEFVGLPAEQKEMIRYWIYRSSAKPADFKDFQKEDFRKKESVRSTPNETPAAPREPSPARKPRVHIGRRAIYILIALMLALGALGWWEWQRSWNELENKAPAGESLRVSSETMEKRIITKVEPIYPEAARIGGIGGRVELGALIGPEGGVERLWPVSGRAILVQSAMEAVRSWKFEPYLQNGKAVEVESRIVVEFRLQ